MVEIKVRKVNDLGKIEVTVDGRVSAAEEVDFARAMLEGVGAPCLPIGGRGHFFWTWLVEPGGQVARCEGGC